MYNQEKTKLVNSVFSDVYKKYDLMNDILSFGVHRLWKQDLMSWMKPSSNHSLVDVASGTGDIAKLFSKKLNNNCEIVCIEPNKEMMSLGKKRLKNFKNIKWINTFAEKLPLSDNSFDFYTISFGLRNVTNIDHSVREAYRVLKPGGRFFCLEFSKIENELLSFIYDNYSKFFPKIGKLIIGKSKPYEYLADSIKKFHNQDQLKQILINNKFSRVEFRNLSGGIAAIHSGWKI